MLTTTRTDQLLIHTAASILTLAEITRAMQGWYEDAAFDAELPVLWDLRGATVDPDAEDLSAWVRESLQLIGAHRVGQKTAWVFGDAALAATAVDLLSAYEWRHRVRIYHNDREAAEAWLTSTIR